LSQVLVIANQQVSPVNLQATHKCTTHTTSDYLTHDLQVLVIADQQASPVFIAADLLSQAEHGPDSQVRLTPSSNACGLIL